MAFSPTAITPSDTGLAGELGYGRRHRIMLRLRVWMATRRLDGSLAAGAPLNRDPLIALRAAQLASRRERRRLAMALDAVRAERPARPGFSASVPVSADALVLARPALEQLAGALRSPGSLEPHGIARTRLLLTEPSSPLYQPAEPEALYTAACGALLALMPRTDRLAHLTGHR
jgi:hypothetical protein